MSCARLPVLENGGGEGSYDRRFARDILLLSLNGMEWRVVWVDKGGGGRLNNLLMVSWAWAEGESLGSGYRRLCQRVGWRGSCG